MDISEIEKQIKHYQEEGLKLFVTSSFQTHSLPLLHIISRIDKSIPVYYLNTGYLFPETMEFIQEIATTFDLSISPLEPAVSKVQQKDENGNLFFTSDPDLCCYLNKTQPMEPILAAYDIWINGIRADQNANRRNMKMEQDAPFNSKRYHPMLHWNNKMIHDYRKEYDLPVHPLESKGYLSIGCEPCTRKHISGEDERSTRWFGMNKTECGLHTELVKK